MAYPLISEIKECPYCGHDTYYSVLTPNSKDKCWWRDRFDGEDADNTEAFDGIGYKYSAFAYCDKCKKKIARHIKD